MPDEDAGKAHPRCVFVAVRPALFIARPARGAGWRCGGARRLCVRVRFHRDGGSGDLSIGGGRISGPALPNITRCWIVLEVLVSAGSPGAWKGPKTKGAHGNTETETALHSPGGATWLSQKGRNRGAGRHYGGSEVERLLDGCRRDRGGPGGRAYFHAVLVGQLPPLCVAADVEVLLCNTAPGTASASAL